MRYEPKKYAYPAVFKKHVDGTYTAFFWDLENYCSVEADNLPEAMERAECLLRMITHFWEDHDDSFLPEPTPIDQIDLEENEFVSLVFVNLGMYF